MRILVVDDEKLIRDCIKAYALNENYYVDEACDGVEAVDKCTNNDYDLIIMDIMMPKMDGFKAIEKIREFKNIPVIMLSARTDEVDKLKGFSDGIDDYITKPFSPKELIARVKAVTKRSRGEDVIILGDMKLDRNERTLYVDGKLVELTHTQFEILCLFLTNLNVVLSRDTIILKIWGYDYEADNRTIDAHIKLLRSKIGKYRDNIKTVRKVGYKFEYKE